MPRKSTLTTRTEDRKKLAKLITEGIKRLGLTDGQVADAADIHRSHLSRVIKGEKSLSKLKLSALADILKISRETLLEAAGYSTTEDFDVDLSDVSLLRSLGGPPLKVVTDPRFLDSAIFMWIFSTQPFRPIGIECELVNVDWRDVSQTVSSQKYAIGFSNRRAVLRVAKQEATPVEYWADLCLYTGYGLLAHPSKLKEDIITLEKAKDYIERLRASYCKEGGNPTIVTMGADSYWRILSPLSEDINESNFIFQSFANPDFALSRFLNGIGDLFIGGLPQRLKAQKEGCKVVMSFEHNPFFASLNGIICSRSVVETQKPLLSVATSLWFEVIRKVKTDPLFRQRVAAGSVQLLKNMNGGEISLEESHFEEVFNTNRYEYFPDRPVMLMDAIISIADDACVKLMEHRFKKHQAPNTKLGEVIDTAFSAVRETLQVELDKEKYPYLS